MGNIIIPKKELIYDRPTAPSQINWGMAGARYLSLAMSLSEGRGNRIFDSVNQGRLKNATWTDTNTTWQKTRRGGKRGLTMASNSVARIAFGVDAYKYWNVENPWTIHVLAQPNMQASSFYDVVAKHLNSADAAVVGFNDVGGTLTMAYNVNNSIVANSTALIDQTKSLLYTWRLSTPTTIDFFINGVFDSSVTIVDKTVDVANTATLSIGSNKIGVGFQGNLDLVYIYRYSQPKALIRSIAMNPFQVFASPRERVFFNIISTINATASASKVLSSVTINSPTVKISKSSTASPSLATTRIIIKSPAVYCNPDGPRSAGTGADDATVGSVAWNNPGNIVLSDNSYATATLLLGQTTHYLSASNFNFNIPAGNIITGIVVEIERKSGLLNDIADASVKLVKGGVVSGNEKASVSNWPNADAYASYGGSSDLWGVSLTPADINASNFGIVLSATATSADTASVDHIRITVYNSIGAVNSTATPTKVLSSLVANSATTKISQNRNASTSIALISVVANAASGKINKSNAASTSIATVTIAINSPVIKVSQNRSVSPSIALITVKSNTATASTFVTKSSIATPSIVTTTIVASGVTIKISRSANVSVSVLISRLVVNNPTVNTGSGISNISISILINSRIEKSSVYGSRIDKYLNQPSRIDKSFVSNSRVDKYFNEPSKIEKNILVQSKP